MTLPELYEQQQKELEQFKAIGEQVWKTLQKAHEETASAFDGRENMPEEMRGRMDRQVINYHKEWGMETGERYQELTKHHEQQREKLTSNPSKLNTPVKNTNPLNDNQQEKLQKIIAQQQAIRQRNQEKKRNR